MTNGRTVCEIACSQALSDHAHSRRRRNALSYLGMVAGPKRMMADDGRGWICSWHGVEDSSRLDAVAKQPGSALDARHACSRGRARALVGVDASCSGRSAAMHYLTQWRMRVAAGMLSRGSASVRRSSSMSATNRWRLSALLQEAGRPAVRRLALATTADRASGTDGDDGGAVAQLLVIELLELLLHRPSAATSAPTWRGTTLMPITSPTSATRG
jgi:hypothetical protein